MPKGVDLIGQRFGRLVVIKRSKTKVKNNKGILWLCKCDCGIEKEIISSSLRRKTLPTRSCGCINKENFSKLGKESAIDLVEQRFGRLVVVEKTNKRTAAGEVIWLCKCDCNNYKKVSSGALKSHRVKSCGCLNKELIAERGKRSFNDLSGQRFGLLVVVKRIAQRLKTGNARFLCKCDCGNLTEVSSNNLLSKGVKSCGCLASESMRKNTEFLHLKQRNATVQTPCTKANLSTGIRNISYRGETVQACYRVFITRYGKKYRQDFPTLQEAERAKEYVLSRYKKGIPNWNDKL